MHTPTTSAEVQAAVSELDAVRPRGGGSKSAMSTGANLDLARLTGVLEYDPSEYTITAKAGTTLAEVTELLASKGQYLPFDPPLVEAGGTLGGTVASGLSGPGRFRYGGVRDFLLGIEFVTGDGELHRGGGKVVKNAAGFDFPKLMVGARGGFGVLTEVTFKVFPKPRVYRTVMVRDLPLAEAAALLGRLAMSNLELAALDLVVPGELRLRVGGLEASMPTRLERLKKSLGTMCEVIDDDESLWREAREFAWQPAGTTLVKVPVSPGQLVAMEETLQRSKARGFARRYSVGGNVVWCAWSDALGATAFAEFLREIRQPGVAVRGEAWGLLGPTNGRGFQERLTGLFDPKGKFARLEDQTSTATAIARN